MVRSESIRSRALSKTRYQLGLQCEKRLWLEFYRRELATAPGAGRRARLAQGHQLGELARRRWPGHALVREAAARHESAVRTTARLISDPAVSVLCEAAFEHDGVRVRIDVLARRSGSSSFDLIEVKSASRVKPEHASDAGVQLYVAESCGLHIERVGLLHVDTDYVWQGGAYDFDRLFRLADITSASRAAAQSVGSNVARFRAVLNAKRSPNVDMGGQCHAPHTCPFVAHCTAATAKSASDRRLDPERLAILLHELDYPIAFVAPLVALPALPMLPATRPYERVLIGWALAVMDVHGRMQEQRLVARSLEDCGAKMVAALVAALPARGSLLVYAARDRDWLAHSLPVAAVEERVTALAPAFTLAEKGFGEPAAAAAAYATLAVTGLDFAKSRDRSDGPFLDATSAAVEAFDVGTGSERRTELLARLERAAVAEADRLTNLFGSLCEMGGADGVRG